MADQTKQAEAHAATVREKGLRDRTLPAIQSWPTDVDGRPMTVIVAMASDLVPTKVCSQCDVEQPLSEFGITKKSGKPNAQCKGCDRKRTKRNRPSKEQAAQYPSNSRLERAKRSKRWRERHPDRKKKGFEERRRRWRERHPEVRERERQAALLRQFKTTSAKEYSIVLRSDPCSYCGLPMEHVDHIVAVSRGGDSLWTNLTAACRYCNCLKKDKSLLIFMLRKVETLVC